MKNRNMAALMITMFLQSIMCMEPETSGGHYTIERLSGCSDAGGFPGDAAMDYYRVIFVGRRLGVVFDPVVVSAPRESFELTLKDLKDYLHNDPCLECGYTNLYFPYTKKLYSKGEIMCRDFLRKIEALYFDKGAEILRGISGHACVHKITKNFVDERGENMRYIEISKEASNELKRIEALLGFKIRCSCLEGDELCVTKFDFAALGLVRKRYGR